MLRDADDTQYLQSFGEACPVGLCAVHISALNTAKRNAQRIVELLDLTVDDKIVIPY